MSVICKASQIQYLAACVRLNVKSDKDRVISIRVQLSVCIHHCVSHSCGAISQSEGIGNPGNIPPCPGCSNVVGGITCVGPSIIVCSLVCCWSLTADHNYSIEAVESRKLIKVLSFLKIKQNSQLTSQGLFLLGLGPEEV